MNANATTESEFHTVMFLAAYARGCRVRAAGAADKWGRNSNLDKARKAERAIIEYAERRMRELAASDER